MRTDTAETPTLFEGLRNSQNKGARDSQKKVLAIRRNKLLFWGPLCSQNSKFAKMFCGGIMVCGLKFEFWI